MGESEMNVDGTKVNYPEPFYLWYENETGKEWNPGFSSVTYSKNPTIEDELKLFSIFELFSEMEYLQIQAKPDFLGRDYWIYRDSKEELPVCMPNFKVWDGFEEYRLTTNHDDTYKEGRTRVYNQMINFKDRIWMWKDFYDAVFNEIHDRAMRIQSLRGTLFRCLDFSTLCRINRDIPPKLNEEALLNILCGISPHNALENLIKTIQRTQDIYWLDNFDITKGRWNDADLRWEFKIGRVWDENSEKWLVINK